MTWFVICFAAVGNLIKTLPSSERLSKQRSELAKITFPSHPDGFILPIDYGIRVKGLIIEKCRFMDSKKLPLWLVFENADSQGDDIASHNPDTLTPSHPHPHPAD